MPSPPGFSEVTVGKGCFNMARKVCTGEWNPALETVPAVVARRRQFGRVRELSCTGLRSRLVVLCEIKSTGNKIRPTSGWTEEKR